MPDMLTFLLERGKERELANLSEMDNAGEALSNSALTVEPSGTSTETRHVISNESKDTPEAILEDIGTTCCVLDASTFSTCT